MKSGSSNGLSHAYNAVLTGVARGLYFRVREENGYRTPPMTADQVDRGRTKLKTVAGLKRRFKLSFFLFISRQWL